MPGAFLVILSVLQWGQSRPAEEMIPVESPLLARGHQNVTVAFGAAILQRMPPGDLEAELAKIKPAEAPRCRAGTYENPVVLVDQELWLTREEDRQAHTRPAEYAREKLKNRAEQVRRRLAFVSPYVAELNKAFDDDAVPEEQRPRIVKEYSLCLLSLEVYKQRVAAWRAEHAGEEGPPRVASPPGLAVPEGLPAGLGEYLRGAIAWHAGQHDQAIAAWQNVVQAGGKSRSVWAAFMLGRAHMPKDAEAAVSWFHRTRELAAMPGMDDSRFLAAESYGLEAQVELSRANHVQAIQLYLMQLAAGDDTAAISLRDVLVRALTAKGGNGEDADAQALAAMDALAGDARARQVVTAWLVSEGGPLVGRPLQPTDEMVEHWLKRMADRPNLAALEPGVLAWLAYRSGDVEAAKTWTSRAPGTDLTADWVRAKLHFDGGRLAEGQAILERLLRAVPADEVWDGIFDNLADSQAEPFAPHRHIAGELAILFVQRGSYAEALALLMKDGYWVDAAYVAERLMTVQELKAVVDAQYPATAAVYRPDEVSPPATRPADGEESDRGEALRAQWARRIDQAAKTKPADRPGLRAAQLRYLLGRRLIREGKAPDALPYIPPRWRPRLETYVSLLADGRKDQSARAEAGRALWEAAKIAKADGMELMGAELGPDWTVCEGGTFYDDPAAIRATHAGEEPLGPTSDELARLKASAPNPDRRFHYRFVAADLAWEAAALLPDESPETAAVLHTAGCWLSSADPQMALRYYTALVRRCGATDVGKRAKQIKWLP